MDDDNTPKSETEHATYMRKKGDIEIEAIDPIQDIMSEEELEQAHDRISILLDEAHEKGQE